MGNRGFGTTRLRLVLLKTMAFILRYSSSCEPKQSILDRELLTENAQKKAPWLIARRMSLTLHLLLFEQSM